MIQEHVVLAPFTTFRVGGAARWFVEARDEAELLAAFRHASAENLPFAVLGGGSNLLVGDDEFAGLVVRMTQLGVEQQGELFDVAAGESWDGLVTRTVEAGFAGMECLAGIPGTVGASPVQNIGAYGQEVAQTIASVRALDRTTGAFVELSAAQCGFRYRRSVFNAEERDRYVITRVRFRLKQGGEPHLAYADLQRWLAGRAGKPSLAEVAAAVREIRRAKGMVLADGDPDTWSAGSYFRNPVVPEARLGEISSAAGVDAEAMPKWPAGDGMVKLSAAWLLERAGFEKGYVLGNAGLSTKHALALSNRGGATFADLQQLETTIREGVRRKFGVVLEREPVMLGASKAALE